jgi:hypothetical protein
VVAVLRNALRQAARSKYVKGHFSTFRPKPLDFVGDDFAALQRAAAREAGMAGML